MIKTLFLITVILSFSQSVFAGHLIEADKALKKIYKKATRFEKNYFELDDEQVQKVETAAGITFAGSHSKNVVMYTAFENDAVIGNAFEDTVIGKWGPIHYLAGLDKDGVVLEVVVLSYSEVRGKPIAKRRFLKQYRGKSIKDPLKLRSDVDGITGATISSRSLTDGVRKIVHILQIIKKDPAPDRDKMMLKP